MAKNRIPRYAILNSGSGLMYTFGWTTEETETALPWEQDVTDYILNQFVNIVQTGKVLMP